MADPAPRESQDESRAKNDESTQATEEKWLKFWEEEGIYRFDPASGKPVFSIDTPPPTVSGKMHIGHAYSYNQMDFVARYKRMRGYNMFYPFGFDDNGLPTERYTERQLGVKLADVGRQEFIRLCLEETKKAEAKMESSWRRIGTSCDWNLVYRTIDPHAVRTSQASFVDLFEKERAYRAERPSIWCPECATAIAQVEGEDKELPSTFNDITFDLTGPSETGHLIVRETDDEGIESISYNQGAEGRIVISTTRPELIGSCVAIMRHPTDERTAHLEGRRVRVPLFGHEVPVISSDKVDKEKGTGVVMCCTFGDQTDIEWWQENNLPLRISIDEHGKMTDLAGSYKDMGTEHARAAIVRDLEGEGRLLHQKPIKHVVNVHERCGTPIEFLVTKQWFVSYLDLREEFLAKGNEVRWHPEYMKVRYDNWVKGLKWDWCISRQRYFGVPFPVWYCGDCGHAIVATKEDLPVDPTVDPAPGGGKCPGCDSTNVSGETDVMDTWATSSLTPQIALDWVDGSPTFNKIFPMSLRPQAHEIISFWAFNTIVKAHFHHGKIPWQDIMISGFVKLGKGKKMSKSKGDIVEPLDVIAEHSGDALRYWSATGANLGEDIIWNPKDLTRAQRLMTKIKNLEGFVAKALDGKEPVRPASLDDVDTWILTEYSNMVARVTTAWENYDYTKAVKDVENFFWHTLADHYIELVKHRLYGTTDDPSADAARWTLYTVGLGTLKLFAPVMVFSTEDVYQEHFRAHDGAKSVHTSAWPEPVLEDKQGHAAGELVKDVVAAVRAWKGENRIMLSKPLGVIEVVASESSRMALERNIRDITGTLKAESIRFIERGEIEEKPVAVDPVFSIVGPKYRAQAKLVNAAIKNLDAATTKPGGLTLQLEDGSSVDVAADEYIIRTEPMVHGHKVSAVVVGDVTLLLEPPAE